jgi:uncharacterized membrane protein YphA (DoxX/SURF4 family)
MNEYDQQKMKQKKAKRGKVLLWIGLIITLVAVILVIVGILSNPVYAVIGGILLVLGITAMIFGLQMQKQNKSIDIGIMTVKCKNCGYLERAGAEFCSKCGKPM